MARKRREKRKRIRIGNECLLKVLSKKANEYIAKRIAEVSKDANVIYLDFRIPSSEIIKILDKKGADFSNIKVIDASGTIPSLKNIHIRYVKDSTQLTETSIILGMFMKKYLEKPVLLIVDSASSLRNYVSTEVVIKFIHYLINRSKINNVATEIIVDKKDVKDSFFKNISQYCDEVIK